MIKAAAWGVVAAGVAAPLLRKRVSAPPLLTQTIAFAGPLGLCVAVRRSRARDVATCVLQMWAYIAAYKTPHDDEAAQSARVYIDYPTHLDRVLGLGELPTQRLQRTLAVIRMQQLRECGNGRRAFVFLVLQQFEIAGRKIRLAIGDVPIPEAVIGASNGKGEAFFAFPQGRFGERAFDQIRSLPGEHVQECEILFGRGMRRPPVR